MHNLHP